MEAPLTDWLQEAYELSDARARNRRERATSKPRRAPKKKARDPPKNKVNEERIGL